MKVLSFINHKGGVGKTTTTFSVAGEMAYNHNKRVLLIDGDPQMNLSDTLLHEDESYVNDRYGFNGLVDLIEGKCNIKDCIYSKEYEDTYYGVVQKKFKLDIIPWSSKTRRPSIEDYSCLRKALKEVEEDYDIVLIDSPPSDTPIVELILATVNYIVIPIEPVLSSVTGQEMIVESINACRVQYHNLDANVIGTLFVRVNDRSSYFNEMMDMIKADNPYCFNSYISLSVLACESMISVPLCIYDKKAKITKQYADVTTEVLERMGEGSE